MVSSTTLQVVIQAKDQLTQKVNEINNKLKTTGNTATQAMNQTKAAATQATQAMNQQSNSINTIQTKYNNLRNTVTQAFNGIKQAIINSNPSKYITASSIAQPFKNAAESIRSKWQQMTEQIKSSMRVLSNQKISTGTISNAGLATLNGQIATTTTKTNLLSQALIKIGPTLGTIGAKGSAAFSSLSSKIQSVGGKLTNLASGLSGVQGMLMSAFAAVGVTSLKSFTIEAAIAREKVNAVTQAVAGSQQSFVAAQKSIKNAIAGTTLGYNNMATAVNNVALRFHVTGNAIQSLPGPMAKVGILAQAMGKSSQEAASIMEHAFDGLQGKWRSLKQIGITEDDLKAAGWSGAADDIQGYAAALDKVLEKNPKFKEFTSTFEYQWESLKMSIKGVGTEIGLMILPILKKVVGFFADLSKNNPGLLKMIVVIGMIAVGITSLATAILPVIMLITSLGEAMEVLRLKTIASKVATVALKVATAAWNIVTKAATIAQAALNLVMDANPIMIVVLAIIALIGILWYLYNTNEDVRNALNGLWDFLQNTFAGVWEWLSGAIQGCGDAIGGFMEWLGLLYQKFLEILPMIMAVLMPWTIMFDENVRGVAIAAVQGFVQWISTLGAQVWTWLMDVINRILAWRAQVTQNMITTALNAVNGFVQWIMTLPGRAWTYLYMVVQRVLNFRNSVVSAIRQAASDLVRGFADKIKEMPQKMLDELNHIKDNIVNFAGKLWQAAKDLAWNAVMGFIAGLDSHSPGIMARTMQDESGYIIGAMEDNLSTMGAVAGAMADSIVTGFGTPELEAPNLMSLMGMGGDYSSAPIANEGDTGITPNLSLDINPTLNTDTSAITENFTVMSEVINPIITGITANMNNLGLTSQTNTTQLLLNNQQITLSYQQLQLNLTQALNQIQSRNNSAWTNIKSTTITNLNSILSSTKNVTQQMIGAWQTMKNSIIQAAQDIKSQSESRFNSLWSTIRTFYQRIQHPGGAGSPTLQRRGRSRGGNAFSSFATAVNNRLGNRDKINRQTLSGLNRVDVDYILPRGASSVNAKDFIKYYNAYMSTTGAGWSSVVRPNVNWIRSTTNKWDTAPPTIVRYRTSHGFKVGDFENGEPRVSYGEFRQIAEDVFNQCDYLFYMDSDWYGNWQTAARAGLMNCSDSTDFLLAMAHAFGLSGSKVHGYWNNIGHFWANIEGHKMDTTGWMQRRTWTPSASHSGPVPNGLKNLKTAENDETIIQLLTEIRDRITGADDQTIAVEHQGKVYYEFKHDINGKLPDGLTAEDVVSIMNAHVEDSNFIRLLAGNREFVAKLEKMNNKMKGERNRFA